jgi:hypothetical protein
MPSLIDRIRAIFRQTQPEQQTLVVTAPAQPRQLSEIERLQGETQRAEIVRKCREMYSSDPRAKKMLRMLARDMVKGGFVVKCDDEEAVEIANQLKDRLKLDQRLDDYVRLTARDGDTFLEVGINDSLEIVILTRKPTLEMRRNSNSFDQFTDPERAYWWSDIPWMGQEAPSNAIWFPQWQIVHARWEHDEGSRYGSPMLASGTGHYKKLSEGELDIAVRRKTRAGMKYVHKFPAGTGGMEIEAYKEMNQDTLDDPFAAVQDFFGTVEISAVQGDMQLGDISDVKHQIATWFTAGEVPMELVAYGEDLNRDVLSVKMAEYEETLVQLREWVTAELVAPILELQWMLAGIYPPSLEYSIQWRMKQEPTASDVEAITRAAMQMQLLGWQPEVVARIVSRFLPDVEPDELVSEPEADGAGRVAGIMDAR